MRPTAIPINELLRDTFFCKEIRELTTVDGLRVILLLLHLHQVAVYQVSGMTGIQGGFMRFDLLLQKQGQQNHYL